jgi:hypothetical protein
MSNPVYTNPAYHQFDCLLEMGLKPYRIEDDFDGGYSITPIEPSKIKVPVLQTDSTYYYVIGDNNIIAQVLGKEDIIWRE